jgi:hypothetical protein
MEPPFRYVDATGRVWEVYDFRVIERRRRRVPLNHWSAEGRAFVAVDTGETRIYMGLWNYHSTGPKILANELHFSKPLNATAAERMAGG